MFCIWWAELDLYAIKDRRVASLRVTDSLHLSQFCSKLQLSVDPKRPVFATVQCDTGYRL